MKESNIYNEDDYLQLSGLQHFVYCRRQWALIHIEQQWVDNGRTVEGELFHKNAHNADFMEKRGNVIIARGLRVKSGRLGVSGICDVVEFRKSDAGVSLFSYDGLWQPYPIEYKKGVPKTDQSDEMQLCAQAICLEEMLLCGIPTGSLFYGENRRREEIAFTEDLRVNVEATLKEMHELWEKGYTPKVKPGKGCNACSLKDICLPKLKRIGKVSDYIDNNLTG